MLSLRPVKKLSTQRTSLPSRQQPLAQVGAEEAGAAGDQDALAGQWQGNLRARSFAMRRVPARGAGVQAHHRSGRVARRVGAVHAGEPGVAHRVYAPAETRRAKDWSRRRAVRARSRTNSSTLGLSSNSSTGIFAKSDSGVVGVVPGRVQYVGEGWHV